MTGIKAHRDEDNRREAEAGRTSVCLWERKVSTGARNGDAELRTYAERAAEGVAAPQGRLRSGMGSRAENRRK